jgi:hypothetical protein
MLFLFGAIEMGRALHDFHVVNESVRGAARYLSRVPATCPSGNATGSLDGDALFSGAEHEARAIALAMTGKIYTDAAAAPDLLGYWNYPPPSPPSPGAVTIEVLCINNTACALGGLYEDTCGAGGEGIPHVKLTADVPFTFLFGQLIAPDASISITLSHNVASIGL